MATYRVELVVHGRPEPILVDADSAEQARADLEQAWTERGRKVYRSPDGQRVEVEWKNLAVFQIASITEVQ